MFAVSHWSEVTLL